MDIRAKYGTKVFVTEKSLENGYESDSDQAKKYLKIGEIYTVDYTDVDRCSTDVHLIEFPNVSFNSVCLCDDDDKDDTLMMGIGKRGSDIEQARNQERFKNGEDIVTKKSTIKEPSYGIDDNELKELLQIQTKYEFSKDEIRQISDFLEIVDADLDYLFRYLISVYQGITMPRLEAAEYIKDVYGDDYFLRREQLKIEEIERSIKK